MAFETSVLQNGEWTTRTLDVNTVLRHYDQQDQEASANTVEIERAPVLGLLTQTVIRSPVVHWILPVKLRDSDTNDVAFIGDEFVQIKELRPDGHLWDIIRKENFGARIRNARVLGSTDAFVRDHEKQLQGTQVKDEEDLDGMDIDVNTNRTLSNGDLLPPQIILLQLDSGDSVFLMLRQSENGSLDFVSSRHRVSKSMLKIQPGAHLAIDPSSRYMAIGCSERLFSIYALKSREELQEQYSQGSGLRYVESERHIYVEGVIHKIEFLHPSPDDEKHVILLVLMIRKGKTRMLLYDWETDCDLRMISPHSRRGHLLEEARQMPLLIIPLTIKSAFILVSAETMSICRDFLHGSPRFIDISDRIDPPTHLFHGSGIPLWSSWARPVRMPYYRRSHDDIYIVREDGFIKFIETDCAEEDLVKTEMNIGQLSNNCGPALACLDYLTFNDESGDLLIASGDSCAGAAYLIKAREPPAFTESIQNWSPAQDFVTDSPNGEGLEQLERRKTYLQGFIPQPDRVFTCAGRGSKGIITEFRFGLEASIGLEIPYDADIMDVWVLPSDMDGFDVDGGSLFLLSLGDRSSVLHLSGDATEIVELEPQATKFDLISRTIAANMCGKYQIQVTERSIVFVNGADARTLSEKDLLGVHEDGNFMGSGDKIDLAVVHGNIILFTTRIGRTTYLQLVETRLTDPNTENFIALQIVESLRNLGRYSVNATCLAMGLVAHNICAITAEYDGVSVRILFQPLNTTKSRVLDVSSPYQGEHHLTAIVSIVVASPSPGYFVLVCGTRNGVLVTLEVEEQSFQIMRSWYDRIGATPAIVKKDEHPSCGNIVFVSCDLKIYALTIPVVNFRAPSPPLGRERKINQIFLTDALNPVIRQPPVNSISRLRPNLSGGTDGGLLVTSGSQILLAGLSTQPKTVPRQISIGGSPSRLLYSHHLGCLIVGASVNGKSTLLFIDPDTGEDLSKPLDKKDGNPTDFVSGLGNFNERIFRLLEWSYMKGGKTWRFIIVCTNTGKLLVISAEKGETVQSKGTRLTIDQQHENQIRYWTRHKAKPGGPVHSVAGFDDGIFYCSGEMLFCETLDMTEKRFKRVAEYTLPSPAINLLCKKSIIYALTAFHSLEILRLEVEGSDDETSTGGSGFKIIRSHGDQYTRNTLHHRIISQAAENPVDLVSDKACSIVGLWATHNTRIDTLETIFEAQLPCSILRFGAGRSRPTWDPINAPSDERIGNPDVVPNSATYPETLGLSIDGSLFNFTILDFAAWKFLRFLINLAKQSSKVCEFTYNQGTIDLEPAPEPKIMMHVDGDILRRCLDDGSLKELLCVGQETEREAIRVAFIELLQGLHRGRLEKDAAFDVYVEQAYKDLEFFLRPVL